MFNKKTKLKLTDYECNLSFNLRSTTVDFRSKSVFRYFQQDFFHSGLTNGKICSKMELFEHLFDYLRIRNSHIRKETDEKWRTALI